MRCFLVIKLLFLLRLNPLWTTHPPLTWSPFPHKGRLIDLSLSVLDLHQSVVGSIDYGSLLQWEKVATRGSEASEVVDG